MELFSLAQVLYGTVGSMQMSPALSGAHKGAAALVRQMDGSSHGSRRIY